MFLGWLVCDPGILYFPETGIIGRHPMTGTHDHAHSHDHPHPPHVHFRKGKQVGSWDLELGTCVDEDGFSSSDLRDQAKILADHRDAILRSWNAHWQRQQQQRRR